MEKSKKCRIHPNEYVSNICTRDDCFVQLCSICICDHTIYHNQLNTKPKYQVIRDVYSITNQHLANIKKQTNQYLNKVISIIDGIQKKNLEIQQFFCEARHGTISIVNQTFDDLEHSFNLYFDSIKEKTGLLNQGRLRQIYSTLNKKGSDITEIQKELNSQQFSKVIGTINSQFIREYKSYLEDISKQLTSNQQFQTTLNYRQGNLEDVSGAIKKLITTSVSYPLPSFEPARSKILSRTPIKDSSLTIHNLNIRQLSVKKSNIGYKTVIDMRMPRSSEVPPFVPRAKQNTWLRSDTQFKRLANTFSS